MSVRLDFRVQQSGTRFRIFPLPRHLHLPSFAEPETIAVAVSPAEIEAGPADARMFVVDAIGKQPYNRLTGPPYVGRRNAAIPPGPDGHFDHLEPGSREFLCATMYATVRRVLDIWEDYLGHQVDWHFEPDFARLELIPLIEWDNAQSGYGFLEFGFGRRPGGGIDHRLPYCENFDVLAHELGHSLVFAEVGFPANPNDPGIDYGGLHESAGDLVAIVSVLHFTSIVEHLLQTTAGNLFTVNELSRVGELDASREIRTAFNYHRMSDVGTEPHERSLPLTGAMFDVMVEVFQKTLVEQQLITQDLADRSTMSPAGGGDEAAIQREFEAAYSKDPQAFKDALLDARDYLGELLARTWTLLRPPNFLTYHDVLRAVLRADRLLNRSKGRHQQTIRECFSWREISVLPDSMMLRPRTVRTCSASTPPSAYALSSLEGDALVALARECGSELARRGETALDMQVPARAAAAPAPATARPASARSRKAPAKGRSRGRRR